MSAPLELVIRRGGEIEAIYSDRLPLRRLAGALGAKLETTRASDVEPDGDSRWVADMARSGGGLLGPFDARETALAEEVEWLREHRLGIKEVSA